MAVATLINTAELPNDVAIRVEGVSKSYTLWSSPHARLQHAVLGGMRRLLPESSAGWKAVRERQTRLRLEYDALAEVSLEIKKGEAWGIIGVNGSGKSTLLSIISGNLRPTLGRVIVDGKVAKLDYSSDLNPAFTGRENINLKAAVMGMTRREIAAEIDSIVEFSEIGDNFIDQPVKTYSSGMMARLGFAIVAHVDSDILISDEALAVGDAFFVQKCMNHIRNFLKRGTFLFVTHSTGDVVSLCDKAVWLDHGRVRQIGNAEDVARAYTASTDVKQSQNYLERNRYDQSDLIETTHTRDVGDQDTEAEPEARNQVRIEQPAIATARNSRPARRIHDPRQELLRLTQWRNDILIPKLDEAMEGHGVGGARIEEVRVEDDEGAVLVSTVGAETVNVVIKVRADKTLTSPIVGFQFQNRMGQTLFGDNTYVATLQKPFRAETGMEFEARFGFQMPLLPVGDYAIRAAVAEGEDSDAAMLHVIDAALVIRSVASGARYGMIGVPMAFIELTQLTPEDTALAPPS